MLDFTKSQLWAQARHYITFFCGVLVTFGIVTVAQQNEAALALNNIIEGLEKVIGGIVVLAGILGPIINGWISSRNASTKSQIERVAEIANDPAQPATKEAKETLLTATASMPEVDKIVAPSIAANVPSEKVVTQ